MKYKIILIFIFITSCSHNYSSSNTKAPFNSKGFAYIFNVKDFDDKIIKRKLDHTSFEVAHNKLRPGSLIKITNIKSNNSIIIKTSKRFEYPKFYKILITKPVADKLRLDKDLPLVEVIEVKKNKSFVAKKTKIYKEEEKIHSNAPVQTVTINNISKSNKIDNKKKVNNFDIIIAEFYSKQSAIFLKKRIIEEMTNFNHKKLIVKLQKSGKTSLISGPYNSINLMKNDYIQLINFGFEELDITINE